MFKYVFMIAGMFLANVSFATDDPVTGCPIDGEQCKAQDMQKLFKERIQQIKSESGIAKNTRGENLKLEFKKRMLAKKAEATASDESD